MSSKLDILAIDPEATRRTTRQHVMVVLKGVHNDLVVIAARLAEIGQLGAVAIVTEEANRLGDLIDEYVQEARPKPPGGPTFKTPHGVA